MRNKGVCGVSEPSGNSDTGAHCFKIASFYLLQIVCYPSIRLPVGNKSYVDTS